MGFLAALHRWWGVAFCLSFAMWFASGIVMHFVPFPARLGADAAYFTAIGADRFGQALTELWLKEGVDATRIVVNGGAHTGLYFVTHSEKGHEFSYMRAGSAASRISETDLPVDRIRATKIMHLSGISQAISSSAADAAFAAIDIARDAKRLVSYDPNLRLKLWPLRRARAIIHEAMGLCDIALPGLDDAQALTGRARGEKHQKHHQRRGEDEHAPSAARERKEYCG